VPPYRTADNKIECLVIVLVDIDQLRRWEQKLGMARDFSQSVIEGVSLPLVVVDRELKIRATNPAFCDLIQLSPSELQRRFLPGIASSWGMDQRLRQQLEKLRDSQLIGARFEFEHTANGPTPRVFCVQGRVLQPDNEQFILVTLQDMTIHKEAERLLKNEKDRLATEVEIKTKELGRSQEELRALAFSLFSSQEEERRRIARELHDDISQRLASLEIDTDKMQLRLSIEPDAAQNDLRRIRQGIAQLSEDVRLMSHRLHPAMIEDLGLTAALRTLTEEFGQRENTIATFSAEKVPDNIPLETATNLYRITQEALRNVSKHAGPTHTRVSLKGSPQGLRLQVADFGQGFDIDDARHGLGLVSMEERARHIGGTLRIQSKLGEGTKLSVTVPLSAMSFAQAV
jgi:signal transduction histidine kinase